MKPFDTQHRALHWMALLLAVAVVVAGCGGATSSRTTTSKRGMPEDIGGIPKEKEFKEIETALPPYPQDSTLLQFQTRRNSDNHFYIDRDSVSIGEDRVIRYSTVVKSPSGATSTSYEAMRCKTSEYRIYAFGVTSGEWTNAQNSQWQRIPRATENFRYTLYKDYFCNGEAIAGQDEKELIANLRGSLLDNPADRNR
ncbi:MAG: CNP1-like family protein [Betaproteobacteria bacterium]